MNVDELEREIRGYINNPRKQHKLLGDSAQWNQLCSSLDVIGDTTHAVDSYEQIDWPIDIGQRYLLTYGLLQALFLQQDAVRDLCIVLNFPFKRDDVLDRIRRIRTTAVGHPTKTNKGSSHFISQISMAKEGFTLLSAYSDSRRDLFEEISVLDLIQRQRSSIERVLTKLLERLNNEEMAHKEKFKDQRLADLFPKTMSYHFTKIFDAIQVAGAREMSRIHVNIIRNVTTKFRSSLEEREEIPAHDHVAVELEWAQYSMAKVEAYFSTNSEEIVSSRDAYIFTSFLMEKMNLLREMAEEFDEEYFQGNI